MDYIDIIEKMNSVDQSFMNRCMEFIQSWSLKRWGEWCETDENETKPYLSYKYVHDQIYAKSNI